MITKKQHIAKHTKRENTYDENCVYCNPSLDPLYDSGLNYWQIKIKRGMGL